MWTEHWTWNCFCFDFCRFSKWYNTGVISCSQMGLQLLQNWRKCLVLYLFQISQSDMSVCLIISVFCKSSKPICEPEITPVLYHLENLQKSKQKQFHCQCSVQKSYKPGKWKGRALEIFKKIWKCHLFSCAPSYLYQKKVDG